MHTFSIYLGKYIPASALMDISKECLERQAPSKQLHHVVVPSALGVAFPPPFSRSIWWPQESEFIVFKGILFSRHKYSLSSFPRRHDTEHLSKHWFLICVSSLVRLLLWYFTYLFDWEKWPYMNNICELKALFSG